MMGDIEKQMRTALATGRGWALGAFLFLGVIGSLRAAEPPGVERLKRLGQWMAHYYEHPEPNGLPRWMQEISASGGLEKASARYPVMVFVSEVVIRTLLERADLHDRLLHGSDYPLPGILPLISSSTLARAGLLPRGAVTDLDALREHNPLLFDFVQKRLLSWQGHAFSPAVFDTRRIFGRAAQ